MCYAQRKSVQNCLVTMFKNVPLIVVTVFIVFIYPHIWAKDIAGVMRTILSMEQHWTAATPLLRSLFQWAWAHFHFSYEPTSGLDCILNTQGPWHENATDQKTRHASGWNNQFAFPWEVDASTTKAPTKYVMLYQRFTAFYASVVNVVQVGMYWNFTTSREKGLMEKDEEKTGTNKYCCWCRSKGNRMSRTRHSFRHCGEAKLASQVL